MKAVQTSQGINEKKDISNGIENGEVAVVQPGKGIRYHFPHSGGLFSEAAKRQKIRNSENINDTYSVSVFAS